MISGCFYSCFWLHLVVAGIQLHLPILQAKHSHLHLLIVLDQLSKQLISVIFKVIFEYKHIAIIALILIVILLSLNYLDELKVARLVYLYIQYIQFQLTVLLRNITGF